MTRIRVPRQRIRQHRAGLRPRWALYWAYGSNLNFAHMERRCPSAAPVAPLYFRHMGIVFRNVADVTIRQDGEAPGGLWRISEQDERTLDSFEGVSSRVYLKRYFTACVDGELEDVLFYQMATHRGVMPPSEQYLRTVEGGYADFGLDPAYLSEALEQSWTSWEITPALRERYSRRGRPQLASRPPQVFTLSEDDLREAGAL